MKIALLLVLGITYLSAQSKKAEEILASQMQLRNYTFHDSLLRKPDFQQQVITRFEEVAKKILDYPSNIRNSYYESLVEIYKYQPKEELRKKIVELLLQGCLDQSQWLRLNNMHDLTQIAHAEDFNSQRLNMLKKLIQDTSIHTTPLFLLVGKLNWPEGEKIMRNFFTSGSELLPEDKDRPGGYRASPKWRSAMALAKIGDKQALEYLKNKASAEPNKDVLYDIFDDFVFVRSREGTNFIITYLFSEEGTTHKGHMLQYNDFWAAHSTLINLITGYREYYNGLPLAEKKTGIRQWMEEHRTSYEILPDK